MITQAEADHLMGIDKLIESPEKVKFPQPGEQIGIDVLSSDRKEKFILDVNRGRIVLSKCTYQNRYRKDIILLRLDIDGPDHTNPGPDGETITCPHLHIYREGFGDKCAFALPNEFTANMDLVTKLFEFLEYCKIGNADELSIQGVI
jgi:hypothetical protein